MAETHIHKGMAQGLYIYINRVIRFPTERIAVFNEALNLVFSNTKIAEYWFNQYYPDETFEVSERAWTL